MRYVLSAGERQEQAFRNGDWAPSSKYKMCIYVKTIKPKYFTSMKYSPNNLYSSLKTIFIGIFQTLKGDFLSKQMKNQ